jgi:hypothetical protein
LRTVRAVHWTVQLKQAKRGWLQGVIWYWGEWETRSMMSPIEYKQIAMVITKKFTVFRGQSLPFLFI